MLIFFQLKWSHYYYQWYRGNRRITYTAKHEQPVLGWWKTKNETLKTDNYNKTTTTTTAASYVHVLENFRYCQAMLGIHSYYVPIFHQTIWYHSMKKNNIIYLLHAWLEKIQRWFFRGAGSYMTFIFTRKTSCCQVLKISFIFSI